MDNLPLLWVAASRHVSCKLYFIISRLLLITLVIVFREDHYGIDLRCCVNFTLSSLFLLVHVIFIEEGPYFIKTFELI